MSEIVTVHDAKTRLSQLLAKVEAGEEVTIARGRVAIAKLVPIAPKPQRKFGALRRRISIGPEFFDPLPEQLEVIRIVHRRDPHQPEHDPHNRKLMNGKPGSSRSEIVSSSAAIHRYRGWLSGMAEVSPW